MTPGEAIDYHSSAGYRLRCAREQEHLSIRDVASAINLLVSHVRAIEANRCDKLAKDEQFLRRLHDYASLVDLDANEVVDSYRTQSEAIPKPIQPLLAESKQRHSGAWLGVGASVLVCVCLAMWLLNQHSPSESSDAATLRDETTEDKQPKAPASKDEIALNTSVENTDAAGSLPTDAANAVAVPPTIDRLEKSLEPGIKNTLSDDETGARPEQAAREPNQKQIAAAQAPPTASISPTKGDSAQLRSTEWYASLDPDRYTLQILSLTKELSARAFIQRHQLEDEAAYFAVRKDDDILYAITYGLYDSYQAAESASKSLPESINDLKPWVRNTGRIQQSMLR